MSDPIVTFYVLAVMPLLVTIGIRGIVKGEK